MTAAYIIEIHNSTTSMAEDKLSKIKQLFEFHESFGIEPETTFAALKEFLRNT